MSQQAKVNFPNERQRLLEMKDKEQSIRLKGDFTSPETVLEMLRIDRRHQKQLVKILEVIQQPSVKNVGYDGCEAIWLIAQHAAYDLALMKKVLNLMKSVTSKDPAQGYYRGIPYLTDRVNIMEGKPQLYGTQFWASPDGTPVPYPVKDLDRIEERRKEFGLKSFKDYRRDIVEKNELTKRPIYYILY